VTANDADGNAITSGTTPYVDSTGAAVTITITDPDTNAHGSCLGASTTCTTGAATTATLTTASGTAAFDYDGLAENPVTLTATSSNSATSGTAIFQPGLNAPVFNSSQATPSGVALTASAEIDLFNVSGTGSTGSESFTELGWTGSPYGHALTATAGTCVAGAGLATALSQFATISAGTNDTTNGTPITATESGATPTAGSCAVTIADGLTSNTTDGAATLTVTYTTSSVSSNGKHRRN
jgi:hypothetical protein